MTRTLLEILEKIRERVRPIVPNMPEQEFDDLTARMAEVEYKYLKAPDRLSTFPPDVARRERQRLTPPTGMSPESDGPAADARLNRDTNTE